MPFDAVDAQHRVGRFVVRRARPDDAEQYSRVDAELVTTTYADVMPPEFGERQRADVPASAVAAREAFGRDLADERSGREPARRTWVALEGERMVGIAVSSGTPQSWEEAIGASPVTGISRQLDHLYLDASTWGSGLADAMLDLALPDRSVAYLWIVGGNDRAWRFYARHGFVGDGRDYECGPLWYHRTLHRMVRRDLAAP
ncbi:MAG: GNAT family N-acetyltransferase [Propionicimonas sp.]|uniref:GNAT family N-acetyltransferase n=1 Tax=Propionicimonas sp. TaxID=1955623 RepID=UPI003D0A8C4E